MWAWALELPGPGTGLRSPRGSCRGQSPRGHGTTRISLTLLGWAAPRTLAFPGRAELLSQKALLLVALRLPRHRCVAVYGLLAMDLAGSEACSARWLCRFQVMKTQGPGSRQGNPSNWSVWGLGFLPWLAQTAEAGISSV